MGEREKMKLKRFEREANQSSIDLKDREKHNTQNEKKHYVDMQRRKENVITGNLWSKPIKSKTERETGTLILMIQTVKTGNIVKIPCTTCSKCYKSRITGRKNEEKSVFTSSLAFHEKHFCAKRLLEGGYLSLPSVSRGRKPLKSEWT